MNRYFTVKEISIALNVCQETVRRWIRDGKLASIQNSKKEGNIITESDFLDFCNVYRNKHHTNSETKSMVIDNEILRAIEFHKSEIKRLESMLK